LKQYDGNIFLSNKLIFIITNYFLNLGGHRKAKLEESREKSRTIPTPVPTPLFATTSSYSNKKDEPVKASGKTANGYSSSSNSNVQHYRSKSRNVNNSSRIPNTGPAQPNNGTAIIGGVNVNNLIPPPPPPSLEPGPAAAFISGPFFNKQFFPQT
jgi:hypothetical protein